MGNKRKREKEQEEPTAAEAEPTGPDAEAQEDPAADGPGGEQHNAGAGNEQEGGYHNSGRRRKSLVSPETASYLEEVVAHFKTLVDDEERCLLVGNVLEEVSGHEVQVAGDPVCSRHIETLMGAASASQLLAFLTAVSDVDGFFAVVSGWGGVSGRAVGKGDSWREGLTATRWGEGAWAAWTHRGCRGGGGAAGGTHGRAGSSSPQSERRQ